MASTVLPNGIIIPEKYSRDWYANLYHNWQELDNLLGGGTPKDGTLTIQKNGTTVGTFSANQATNETVNITVPDVNNGTLTIQKNGTTVDSFSANSSTDKTVDITVPTKTSDLTNDSGFITSDNSKIPLAGSNQISGDLIPATDNSIDIGSSTNNIKMLYTKGITIDAKTIDTDANDNMTYDGHIVDTIEEQGDGYIRYSNGLQICWGFVGTSNVEWVYRLFPKPFIDATIYMTATQVYAPSDRANFKDAAVGVEVYNNSTFSIAIYESANWTVNFHAIGRWK